MKDVITDNSRMHRRTGFKLGGRVGHVTRHVRQLFKVKIQTSRSQGHVTYHQTEHFNSAVDDHINLKLGGNYQHGGRRVWYTFRSVCQTNRKSKYGGHSAYKMQKSMEKRLQIAEISSAVSYEAIAS